MTKREFIELISDNGFKYVRNTHGSHELWQDNKGHSVTVSIPKGKDYAKGTLNAMLKQAGLK